MFNLSQNIESLYLKKPVNRKRLTRYFESDQITFFNWEFFDQKLIKDDDVYRFQFDFSLEETKTYQKIYNEQQFCKLIPTNNPDITYWKIIPDEEITILWPEVILRTGEKNFEKELVEFKSIIEQYTRDISPIIKVERLSKLIEKYSLGKVYFDAYWQVYSSFDQNYNSLLVDQETFLEDFEFRKTHYSNKPVLSERLIKEYAVKMFAVYAAETSVMFALQNKGIFPNLVLVSNESERAIKKYETLAKIEKRPLLPKIFVL